MSADFIPHGGLIRADDLEQGVTLKPSEITQFIRTIDAEVFEKKHAAAENTFQPKSLFDLAKAASERAVAQVLETEILPKPEPQTAQEPQDRPENPGPAEADTTPPLEATTEPQDDTELEPKEDLTSDLPSPESPEVAAPEPESPEDKATAAAVEEAYQRGFQDGSGLVADGRDMGTTVFPDAILKVYLTASVEARADRRYKQLIAKGIDANLPALRQQLEERDARDSERSASPLHPAEDAFVIDSTELSIQQTEAQLEALARDKGLLS